MNSDDDNDKLRMGTFSRVQLLKYSDSTRFQDDNFMYIIVINMNKEEDGFTGGYLVPK